MTLKEFKAWLEGYLEDNSATPSKKLKRIQEKLDGVYEDCNHWTWCNTTGTSGLTTEAVANTVYMFDGTSTVTLGATVDAS